MTNLMQNVSKYYNMKRQLFLETRGFFKNSVYLIIPQTLLSIFQSNILTLLSFDQLDSHSTFIPGK